MKSAIRRKETAWVLALLAFGVMGPARAQDAPVTTTGLDLQTAQKEALERSPDYQHAKSVEQEKSWGQLEAVSEGFLPHVHAKGQYFLPDPQYGSLNVQFGSFPPVQFPGIFPEKTLTLDADFDLFDGFRNVHQLDAANNRHEAAQIQSDFALLQLTEQVRLKYYTALGDKLLSDMADENVKTLEDHLRIVQDQLANGQATKYDVLRVEVQLSVAKSDQISAHDNVALAREDLSKIIGLPGDDRPLASNLPALDSDVVLKAAAEADFKDSPQLKAKQLQALAAGDQSAASQAFWFPKVSLIGEYQWYDSPDYLGGQVSPDNNFRNSYFVGAAASWDVLDGGLSVAKANESDEHAKQARDDYKSTELETPYEFDLWKRKLVSSVALYKARLEDVDKAKESVRLAKVGFQAGTRTTTDVLDAELEQYQASAGLVESQLGALVALINLELVTGKRLTHD